MSTPPPRNPFAPPDPNRPRPEPVEPDPVEADPVESGSAEPDRGRPQQAPTPPPTPPGGKGPKRDGKGPSPEALKDASATTFRFGAVLILALLATQLPIPYMVISPLFIAGAILMGVIALCKSWAISPRNLMTPMLIAGIIMAAMMSVTAASKFVLWPVELEHQECVRLALTNSAKAECEVSYQDAVAEHLSSLRGASSD